jgi:hypothetical protein
MPEPAPRTLFDSDFLFGVHEPGGEELMLAAGKPGWVVFTEAVGHDAEDYSGLDFSTFANDGLGVICRINHGYEPEGTLPHSSLYEAFARRVANFVGTSQGCKIWILGNEMNYAVERPARPRSQTPCGAAWPSATTSCPTIRPRSARRAAPSSARAR